jgi:lipopolysaccharide/colanic/teichoic acid biosynthesis glycosyltransferase
MDAFWAVDIGLLVFLPFMLLWAVMILPESPGGKALRKFVHRVKESKNKTGK